MANNSIGYQNADIHGRAAFEVLDSFTSAYLLAGGEPGLSEPARIMLASNLPALVQFTVMMLDGNGNATPLTAGGTAIGVLAHATPATAANNTTIKGETFVEGTFNVGDDDVGSGSPLVWDVSFTTRAQKLAVVRQSPTRLFFRSRLPTV